MCQFLHAGVKKVKKCPSLAYALIVGLEKIVAHKKMNLESLMNKLFQCTAAVMKMNSIVGIISKGTENKDNQYNKTHM